ncbi:transcriptional regulator [Dysosmobacter sp. NSJ-60]|uniref:helix-turn-helix transcriptional regulator n=1 Tax=Pusillibacter faecalis TaxID=2714358 RepID=UPI00164DD42A|nr:helix-turn-helix transcriptional regulator [Pusillibacter faecalis]MBC5747863.1 transcriptional regulator [Dysosmobacter hominis]MBS5656888.1 transcriptional regulator [Oscillibacter sp.]MCQ5027022.1 helix-turn-helix transcriptional regulator [Oscillibacter valericigenes]
MQRGGGLTESKRLELLRQVAAGIAAQFGSGCEVVVHDLSRHPDHSIVAIFNGHVTGRKVGDGASHVVLEQLRSQDQTTKDHLCYLTKTPDGKILKSSTIYIRNSRGKVAAILAINYDISRLMMVENAIADLISTPQPAEPEKIVNVNDLLEELIQQSVALVGKPVVLMNKEDKIRAIQFLSQNGAFLVTKSGDKIAKYFGISKYTLYSYIDTKQQEGKHD